MSTLRRLGRDIVVGDMLATGGSTHRITHFADYEGNLHASNGGPLPEGTRIAYSGEWGITVPPDMALPIVDERPQVAA